MKYLRINPTKYVEDMYVESPQNTMKGDLNKCREIHHVHELKNSTMKMSVVPNLTYRFNAYLP